ncbi:hypothetical protein NP590_06635 [Methylomonas sp. SURF-2]|uniref:Endonuclease n=1 Tax=Methylomonas subterranea TaxID=2952225 RepID=A0ABT1TE87_9GAMM|nr:hypothetical protein [Methylomonas sp. SURF-2]MCQ8103776.1 hypothetical protein [Methylomonas sp. SURF-2]
MSTIISEGEGGRKLFFEFSDKWKVCKYDETNPENFYNKLKYNGYKAVDFIAVSDKAFLLIEVKYVLADDEQSSIRFSFEDNRYAKVLQEMKGKLCKEEINAVSFSNKRPYLVDEIDKKVRDTLVGLLASYRSKDSKLSTYNRPFLFEDKPVFVIVFLERNVELNQPGVFKPMASSLKTAIELKLSFLGNIKVDVINTLTIPQSLGIKVSATGFES